MSSQSRSHKYENSFSDSSGANYTKKNYIKAFDAPIKVVSKEDIGIGDDLVGFKGSPTYVAKSFPPHFERKGEILSGEDVINKFFNIIEEKKVEGK